jgi:plasmid replication initiation protein
MSNALTRAAHSLSLAEKRVVAACIAQCDSVPMKELERDGAWTVRLRATDFAETYGIDATTAYEQLKDATDVLMKRQVTFTVPAKRGPRVIKYQWVGKAVYYHGEGWIEIEWSKDIVPHLFGLRKEFVSYKLKHAAALRSLYSWRLFECLKSWQGTGEWSPTIEEFSHAMDVPDKYRANFKETRVRVIEPAVAELREKSGLLVEWETKTAGRKVVGLHFKFEVSPQQQLALE